MGAKERINNEHTPEQDNQGESLQHVGHEGTSVDTAGVREGLRGRHVRVAERRPGKGTLTFKNKMESALL